MRLSDAETRYVTKKLGDVSRENNDDELMPAAFVPGKKERGDETMREDSLSRRFNLFQLEDEEEKSRTHGKVFSRGFSESVQR